MRAKHNSSLRIGFTCLSLLAGLAATGPLRAAAPAGRLPPVILVPGTPATELYDRETGEQMFPRAKLMFAKNGSDFLALPLDNPEDTEVVPSSLITKIRVLGVPFKIDAYGPLLASLRDKGYTEGDWDKPGAGPEYYLFPYDWRQSVESRARMLYRKMTALRAKQPADAPRFVMIGHSLGGLIIRYVMMYGDAPAGTEGPLPAVTWTGGALMSHAWLIATPNEGSFTALSYLYQGTFYRFGWGAWAPETLFTFPSVFDLIPEHHDPLISPEGNPLNWDLNHAEDWEALQWSVFDPGRQRTITLEEARAHLRGELARKTRLHRMLAQLGPSPNPVAMHLVAGDCEPVQRTALVIGRAGGYKVKFKTPNGYDRERLNAKLFEPGDSMVTARSVTAAASPHEPESSVNFQSVKLACISHQKLMKSPQLTEGLLPVLEQIAGGVPAPDTLAATAPAAAVSSGGPAANP